MNYSNHQTVRRKESKVMIKKFEVIGNVKTKKRVLLDDLDITDSVIGYSVESKSGIQTVSVTLVVEKIKLDTDYPILNFKDQ